MLERYVRNSALLKRLREGALGGVLDVFVVDMAARGHSDRVIRDYVREVGLFGQWMGHEGHTAATLRDSDVRRYLQELDGQISLARSGPSQPRRVAGPGLHRLVATLRARGLMPPVEPSAASPADEVVQQFIEYSTRCRGVSAATCRQQSRHLRSFLAVRFSKGPIDFAAISAQDLIEFVAARADRGQTRMAKSAATALRSFLRFLVLQGLVRDTLVGAVPTVVHRGAGLPRCLTRSQVSQLLASFDRSCPVGRRDYAIALCLARLGMRVGEVVALALGDIVWRDGVLRIANGKSRREATLPLPADVGRAIARYIKAGRPTTQDRHVFVSHVVPVGRAMDASAARAVIRRGFERARLDVISKGTHTLRHTVATCMICEGATLKDIADVLRHRSLDTTAVYARVDLPALKSVVLPWPEVR